jgi:preprotein translocase subunit YajC
MANPTAIVLAETAGQTAGTFGALVPFLLIGLVFYFLIIRPQRKKQAEQQQLLSHLSLGDEVVTIGGFHGEIVGLTDEVVDLEIATDVVVTIARNAIGRTLSGSGPVDIEDFDDEISDLDDLEPADFDGGFQDDPDDDAELLADDPRADRKTDPRDDGDRR